MPDPDPQRPRDHDAFDRPDGYSGQDYTIEQERALAAASRRSRPTEEGSRDIPPDAGRRAGADPVTGEVVGSGAGIGGGNPGEDFDSASPSGDAYPLTGGEGGDRTPADLGPAQRDESG